MMPLCLVYNAYFLALLAVVLLIVDTSSIIGMLLACTYLFMFIKRSEKNEGSKILSLMLLYAFSILPVIIFDNGEFLIVTVLLMNLLRILVFNTSLTKWFLNKLNLIILLICCFSEDMLSLDTLPLVLSLTVFMVSIVLSSNYIKDKNQLIKYNFINFMILSRMLPIAEIPMIGTILVCGYLFNEILTNFNDKNIARYNRYIFLFTAVIIIKVLVMEMPLIISGIMLILAGYGFIYTNKILIKKLNEGDNNSEEL